MNRNSNRVLSHFKDFPDEARVWIHGFEHELCRDEQNIIDQELGRFLPQWVSHGVPVKGAFIILNERFIVTIAYCRSGISGCSIDSFIQSLKRLNTDYGLNPLNGGLIYYRDRDGTIQAVGHLQFYEWIESGMVSSDTRVFNTLIRSLGELRSGKLWTTFESSWHARSFRLLSKVS